MSQETLDVHSTLLLTFKKGQKYSNKEIRKKPNIL